MYKVSNECVCFQVVMLKEVIRGQEKASVVLVEDCLSQPGLPVLKAFLLSLQKRVNTIHLLCYEETNNVLQGLSDDVKRNVKCHDVGGDPLGWHCNGALNMDTDVFGYLAKLLLSDAEADKCAVVFDSISNLILHKSASYVCQVVHKLSKESSVEQVVCLVHTELHSISSLKMLHHTCDTILTLSPSTTSSSHGICSSLHIRPSGKVAKLKEQYTISNDFNTIENEEVISITEAVTADSSSTCDPTANLTFNLTLTEKEKNARSQMVLPYIQDKQKQEASLLSSAGEGKIFYQPDDADDFDEEDPDDDLDI